MWQPTASLDALQKRSELLGYIRDFMRARGIQEVTTPTLATHTVTDPYIDSIAVKILDNTQYLQTSPEYAIKRLLAAGMSDCYQIGPAFRREEIGRHHQHEFTMLEWYRLGFNDIQLADEVGELIALTLCEFGYKSVEINITSFKALFQQFFSVNPHAASESALKEIAYGLDKTLADDFFTSRADILQFLFAMKIEPTLGKSGPTLVTDFPACLSALARLKQNADGETVAARFECYVDGLEIANGFYELNDAKTQRARFEADNHARKKLGKTEIPLDEKFLEAVDRLPDCAGVALGVDRLLMCCLKKKTIQEVVAFGCG